MKVLVIWDLHGQNVWEEFVYQHNPDKIIFLWDYVDSFTIEDKDILDNLKKIINFKKSNTRDVILLLWNHDVQYMYKWNQCSGYRQSMYLALNDLFTSHMWLFDIVYELNWYLFSHAGITPKWLEWNNKVIDEYISDWYKWDYTFLNDIFRHTHDKNIITQCSYYRGWTNPFWGPLWADKEETLAYPLEWFKQIVWHTKVKEIETHEHIIYVDCLEWDSPEVLVLEMQEREYWLPTPNTN